MEVQTTTSISSIHMGSPMDFSNNASSYVLWSLDEWIEASPWFSNQEVDDNEI